MNEAVEEAIEIAERIIDIIIEADRERNSYLAVLRLYYRLTTLVKNEEESEWIKNELNGYRDIKSIPAYRIFPGSTNKNEYAIINERCSDLIGFVDWDKKIKYSPYVKNNSNEFKVKKKDFDYDYKYGIYLGSDDFISVLITLRQIIFERTNNILNDLKFGNIVEDIFVSKKRYVDTKLLETSPQAITKFVSVYENLQSKNEEDWANAVHSCRRILKTVADNLYPPSDEVVIKENGQKIKVGNEKYINRLTLYIENKSSSEKFTSIVGSNLKYIGERLDAVYDASNKGSHDEVSLDEAKRYIIYTYLLLGDILSL